MIYTDSNSNIKNIIFDLGGVILGIDHEKTIHKFIALGVENIQSIYTSFSGQQLLHKLETGEVSSNEFRNHLKNMSKTAIPDPAIDEAWDAMILDIPAEYISYLQKLKSYFHTFLLSNTNEIHKAYYNKLIRVKHGLSGLSSLFHHVYYSHELGMRKPDKSVFTYVLNKHGLNPEETLFIDDLKENIISAQTLRINTYLYQPHDSLSTIINTVIHHYISN